MPVSPSVRFGRYLIVLLVCWWAFVFRFVTPVFYNDHFEQLSMARQMLFGELPGRDFFDDSRPLTVALSALLQRISPTLLSEALLTTSAIAAGVGFVFVLARNLSRSTLLGLLAALLTVAMQSRLYSYPKAILFPCSLWLLWRYVDRPAPWRLAGLALLTVIAFLFRYDYGVYIAIVYVVTFAVVHKTKALPAIGLYSAVGLALSAPFLIWLATMGLLQSTSQGGVIDMVRSISGVIRTPVHLDLSRGLFYIGPPPPQLGIRWRADVDAETRLALEERYGLHVRERKLDGRSVRYFIDDPSLQRVQAMLADPRVEDTSGIDRGSGRLLEPPSWDRWQNAIPLLRLTPATVLRTREDAQGWIYYVFMLSIPLSLLALWLFGDESMPNSTAKVLSLALMCLLLDQFLVQGSLDSRLPDVSGPSAVLLAWLARRLFDAARSLTGVWSWIGRVTVAASLAALAVVTWYGVVVYADTSLASVITAAGTPPTVVADVAHQLHGRPIDYRWPPDRVGVAALTRYIGQCLSPEDRLMFVGYAPDVFYFSERRFAGGMSYFHASDFSSRKNQAQTLARLQKQSVPIVIIDEDSRSEFEADYTYVDRYIAVRYREAAVLGFGDKRRRFHVLVDSQRAPLGTESKWGLPCFWAGT